MVGNDSEKVAKFQCKICNYFTCKKNDLLKHNKTKKHIDRENGNILATNGSILVTNGSILSVGDKKVAEKVANDNMFECSCGKMFKYDSGYYRHKKVCDLSSKKTDNEQNILTNQIKLTDLVDKDEIIFMLIKQTSDLIKEQTDIKQLMISQQNMILEMAKNGTNSMSNFNNSNINSNNKTFNLQFFLNETCKDAMNISEFIENIKIDVSDLENMGRVGYVEGMSNILIKNLNVLDITKRPIHCTDKKREIMYIKDNNVWEKDDEQNNKLHKTIKRVSHKSIKTLPAYREKYPGCEFAVSRFSDRYNKMIIEVMGGPGDNDAEKEDRIIQKVAKYITINKGSSDS
jgi:hypothetical protein